VVNSQAMVASIIKHLLHCTLFLSIIAWFIYNTRKIQAEHFDPWIEYGTAFAVFLISIRLIMFLALPQMLSVFLGLTCINAFPKKVVLEGSPLLAPFICIRVVTRGDYPELVKKNVLRHINTCLAVGLENFMVEIATDKAINVQKHRRIREIVVPKAYEPKSGAMFKSRALQYCLEENVNMLNPNDWIVHLDEETILTKNCVRGIVNFVLDGKYPFGQGLITYANENVVNWYTTLADSLRVSDDMGKVRLHLKTFHKPLFSWKGSYVVTQVS
jgi:egghead protein (zeste-white 4 protein)